MRISPRIVVPASPLAARGPAAQVGRAGHARRTWPAGVPARARAAAPARARALASALLGALAGLAAGAVIAAVAPGVGRTASVQPWPATAHDDQPGPRGRAAASPVSAVLAPAIEVGIVPAPDPEAARP